MLRLVIPLGLSALLGFSITAWLWRRGIRSGPLAVLVASLAVGLGFGLSSCSVFLSLVLFDGIGRGLVVTDLAVLGGLGAFALVHAARSRPREAAPVVESPAPRSAVTAVLAVAFGLSLTAVVARFAQMSFNYPHGWWDAWMIYLTSPTICSRPSTRR